MNPVNIRATAKDFLRVDEMVEMEHIPCKNSFTLLDGLAECPQDLEALIPKHQIRTKEQPGPTKGRVKKVRRHILYSTIDPEITLKFKCYKCQYATDEGTGYDIHLLEWQTYQLHADTPEDEITNISNMHNTEFVTESCAQCQTFQMRRNWNLQFTNTEIWDTANLSNICLEAQRAIVMIREFKPNLFCPGNNSVGHIFTRIWVKPPTQNSGIGV